jgi:hypothetical protein
MRKEIILLMITIASAFPALAQQLPANTWGIVNIYDNAGNRTKRVYFYNNTTDPYPARKTTENVPQVDALYPNPTTGTFSVTFSRALNNAVVSLLDVNGKPISRFKANGNRVDFDLSPYASGIYFVRIDDAGNIILKKVIKL